MDDIKVVLERYGEVVTEAALRARERHPMGYPDKRDPPFWYWRCPECEQWSPCDVRIMCDAIHPAGAETREGFVERYRSLQLDLREKEEVE